MHKREFDLKIALFTLDEVKKSTGNKIQAENGEEQKGHSRSFFQIFICYTKLISARRFSFLLNFIPMILNYMTAGHFDKFQITEMIL